MQIVNLKKDEEKIKSIVKYYHLTNRLKDLIRTGWVQWGVKRKRVESVAEHIYGTCMLAVSIWSETLPEVNLSEVLIMLALHETEEIMIGDITPYDDERKQKLKKGGMKAVEMIFSDLIAKDVYHKLIKDFNERSTKEAVFAQKCDKLEACLQARLYSDEGALLFDNAGDIKNDERIINLKQKEGDDVAKYFCRVNEELLDDENDIFYKINKYVKENNIIKKAKG